MNEKSLAVQYGIFKVICIVYFVTVFFFFFNSFSVQDGGKK